VYSTSLEIHKEINGAQPTQLAFKVPVTKHGSREELETVLKELDIPVKEMNTSAEWVSSSLLDSVVVNLEKSTTESSLKQGVIPNLTGMTARDVMYLLENNGMRVKLIGSGSVAKQSLPAGTTFKRGTEIVLQLI
ncbi:MAG TPA: PASTA domain-containing protein, partial [Bacteroidia bacterium]|nr:PASTA domain-containing protein [Bacteroidia bacterium]